MENFALIALAESLRPALDGCIIRRVIQHQPNGFILQTRSAKLPALKLLMDARNPAFYPSEAKPPMESSELRLSDDPAQALHVGGTDRVQEAAFGARPRVRFQDCSALQGTRDHVSASRTDSQRAEYRLARCRAARSFVVLPHHAPARNCGIRTVRLPQIGRQDRSGKNSDGGSPRTSGNREEPGSG